MNERSGPASSPWLARLLAASLVSTALFLPPVAAQDPGPTGGTSRERAALAEEQALLQRQLSRLRQTMEILATRFEAEGRTHAAKLLRDGLAHIAERAVEHDARTLDELMSGAQTNLEAGQSVQALEVQEAAVKSLERLYAILTDRRGAEDLERSLEELRKIQADLAALADREGELRGKTAALEERASGPERQELQKGILKALEVQRDLLARTESRARESGEMQLEAIERALEALRARQARDASVLESWNPAERPALESAAPPFSQAAERASRAERLAQAARELRRAADAARDPAGDPAAAQRDLESAAGREERRDRARGESTDSRAAAALRRAAEALAGAQTPAARTQAAQSAADEADALERAAQAELAAAQERREAALAALEKLQDKNSSAAETAARAQEALRASEEGITENASTEERAAAARQGATDAGREIAAGQEEQAMLPKALSGSQTAAAEESARLERALAGIDEGRTDSGQEARRALSAAAQAQKAAAQDASKGDPSQAARSARESEGQLAAAAEALARARAERGASSQQDAGAQALAKEQEALAESQDDLARKAEATSLSQAARESARKALSAAQSSMRSASRSLSKGSNSSAAGEQREAISKLQEAAEKAALSPELTRSQDQEEARAMAVEQEKIREELLELAGRNQKRETAKPTPSLAAAGESAGRAQESLEEGDLSAAQESEEQAERKMREALRELSEEEEEYQKLRAEELLFKVAEQVKALLEGHREQVRATLEIDGARREGQSATHTQRLRLRKVSKAEHGLGVRAGEIGRAIRAEQSLIFAEVLDESARDLERLARDLGEDGGYQSGERVQGLQQDVEQGLVWLYEALQAEKERRRQESQGGGGGPSAGPGQNRLVPDTAELKLLRSLEVENLQALEKLKILHPEVLAGQAVDPLVLEDIGRLAHRHQRTSDLFEQFRKRLGLPDPPPSPHGGAPEGPRKEPGRKP